MPSFFSADLTAALKFFSDFRSSLYLLCRGDTEGVVAEGWGDIADGVGEVVSAGFSCRAHENKITPIKIARIKIFDKNLIKIPD